MIRIFNVWHHRLFPELLEEVPMDHRKDVVLYGVNDQIEKEYDPIAVQTFPVLFEYHLPKYESVWQAKNYCQSSCLYHVYSHQQELLFQGQNASPRYVGFMQYDMKIASHAFDWLAEAIHTADAQGEEIIFHENTIHLYEAVIHHEPCLLTHALPHYNRFFETSVTADDLMHDIRCHRLPMVHTFIIPIDMFQRMMAWLTVYMKDLEAASEYPFRSSQADYLERVHALFLALECKRPNVQMAHLNDVITHVWPMYHKQVKFENYHIRVEK